MSTLFSRGFFFRLPVFAAAFAMTASFAFAAKIQKAGINPNTFGIRVSGTDQEFYGRADLAASVSFQEYTTGALFVSEVDVDLTGGGQLLRIYFARPFSSDDLKRHAGNTAAAVGDLTNGAVTPPPVPEIPTELTDAERKVQDAAARATGGLVLKTYPNVTHAKTVDFSVGSRAELLAFYKNFRDLFCRRQLRAQANGTLVPASTKGGREAGIFEFNGLGNTIFTID